MDQTRRMLSKTPENGEAADEGNSPGLGPRSDFLSPREFPYALGPQRTAREPQRFERGCCVGARLLQAFHGQAMENNASIILLEEPWESVAAAEVGLRSAAPLIKSQNADLYLSATQQIILCTNTDVISQPMFLRWASLLSRGKRFWKCRVAGLKNIHPEVGGARGRGDFRGSPLFSQSHAVNQGALGAPLLSHENGFLELDMATKTGTSNSAVNRMFSKVTSRHCWACRGFNHRDVVRNHDAIEVTTSVSSASSGHKISLTKSKIIAASEKRRSLVRRAQQFVEGHPRVICLWAFSVIRGPQCLSGQTTRLPNFRKLESCRTMTLVGGFSRGSPVSPTPSFQRRSIFTSITLIGSQDLSVKSRPNLFTHSFHTHRLSRPSANLRADMAALKNVNDPNVSQTVHEPHATSTEFAEHFRMDIIRLLLPCKSAISAEMSRACLINADPIAQSIDERGGEIRNTGSASGAEGRKEGNKRVSDKRLQRMPASLYWKVIPPPSTRMSWHHCVGSRVVGEVWPALNKVVMRSGESEAISSVRHDSHVRKREERHAGVRTRFASVGGESSIRYGATVAERLACSPPTNAIRVQSPAGSLWIFACGNRAERCRLSAGLLGDLPFLPPLSFRRRSILTSITLIGSQDLAVTSRPNLFIPYIRCVNRGPRVVNGVRDRDGNDRWPLLSIVVKLKRRGVEDWRNPLAPGLGPSYCTGQWQRQMKEKQGSSARNGMDSGLRRAASR
ncbi:hypothetical protein PR048_000927 [Dryococelus australis]|uniref:Uncharacterized protein n=1 Tax=Dryococelus australis TaxID=614101 RepID=A0ABQ9IG30_9NEOP|nr:hypothetical protein PR048_000927 [Dryococelus australis]